MAELVKMDINYPPRRGSQELNIRLVMWMDELPRGVCDDDFIAACKAHRRSKTYFPRLDEIVSAISEIHKTRLANRLIPQQSLTDEQVALNLQKINELRDKLSKKHGISEYIKNQPDKIPNTRTKHADRVRRQAMAIRRG